MIHHIIADEEIWQQIEIGREVICIPKSYYTVNSDGLLIEMNIHIGDILKVTAPKGKKVAFLTVTSHWQGDKYMVPAKKRMVGVKRLYNFKECSGISGMWFVNYDDLTGLS